MKGVIINTIDIRGNMREGEMGLQMGFLSTKEAEGGAKKEGCRGTLVGARFSLQRPDSG